MIEVTILVYGALALLALTFVSIFILGVCRLTARFFRLFSRVASKKKPTTPNYASSGCKNINL